MVKILHVNKYYHLRSGTERYMFNLTRLLELHGHIVAIFSMRHPDNLSSPFAGYFVPQVDYGQLGWFEQVRAALRALWYPAAARQMARLLDDVRPDVVHIHNIYHQVSPSVLPVIRQRGIPIVHTLHDYKLICPNYLLRTQGQTCRRCQNRRYYQAIRHRCLHGSLAWSTIAAVEMTLHKCLQIYERSVSCFIAPSQFLFNQTVAFGVQERQINHIPYFLFADEWRPAPACGGEYALFVGRLSEEKGLPTLLAAVRDAQVPLLIAGEGPMRPAVETAIARDGLTGVRLAGHLDGAALTQAVAGARFAVVPSEWYEVFGQVIIESFAQGRPVVASDIGGISQVVSDGVDGLLTPPGDPTALAAALRWLWERPQIAAEMGRAGRAKVEAHYDAPAHYQRIMALYQEVGH